MTEIKEAPGDILSIIDKYGVTLYSKSYCPYCLKAKNILKNLQTPFTFIELDSVGISQRDQKRLTLKSGISTVPKVFIGEKCIGGASQLEKAYKNKKIFDLFDELGIKYDKDLKKGNNDDDDDDDEGKKRKKCCNVF